MIARRLAPLAISILLAAAIAGCVRPPEEEAGSELVRTEWPALLEEVRAFERRIGFRKTDNFLRFSGESDGFPFCGRVSRFYLPYSYEDPAIRWSDSVTERECRRYARRADVFQGATEALGEVSTPVTPSMVASPLGRFLYLVIHEDCHDQFDLPYGIEEPLCDVIAHAAMLAFAGEKFGPEAREHAAVRRYVQDEARRALLVGDFYGQLERLYGRHARGEIADRLLLRERARVFREAERALERRRGSINNVHIANDMTYSRHYPFIESVFDALGRDLARMTDFFRRVDALKPARAQVMRMGGLSTEESVDFIRAYEAAVVETIERALREEKARKSSIVDRKT